jgi:hypothetical protein
MRSGAVVFAVLMLAADAWADESNDLDLIPQSPAKQESSYRVPGRFFIQNALTITSVRDDLLVPSPPPLPPRWEERLFGDARIEWPLSSNAHVTYSGRLNFILQEDLGFPNRGNVTHDLRELYVSTEPLQRSYFDAGRINLKSGVALGFNPTDYFKARAVVDPLTADPGALREDRLGTVMLRAQHVGEGSSVMLAYAPKITDPAPIASDPYRGFDPLWGRTNGTERWLVKGSLQLGDGVNPEVLAFHENGKWKFGANIAESVGQSSVVYLEWSGGKRLPIADEALAFGRATGTIPPAAPSVITQGNDERFRNQVALGASYTNESKITFNLEYHYNEAGFSRDDWNRWFNVGEGRAESSPIVRELWYIRGYASDRQEPIQQHSIFLRADWVDAFVPKLELTGFVLADARDGSALLQVEASYARTDLWSFGVLAGGTTGGRRSNFGSLPREASILFKATRYF